MKVIDFDGSVLDATFLLSLAENGLLSVVFESSGGHEGGPNPRNLQYRQGLSVLLRRLQLLRAVVTEIRVETGRTRHLPIEQQRIAIPGRPFPVALESVGDLEEFRLEISRYGRKVGQPPELAADGGGSSRRLRLFLIGVTTELAVLERDLAGRGAEADGGTVASVVRIAAGKSRGGGQGFLVSQAVRKVVEGHAVGLAISHYRRQGWTVEDVGSTQPYDLRCTRPGGELHVEVKGTTGLGETVILTPNEVRHAQEWHPNVDLFVVTEIHVTGRETDHPTASAGVAHLCPSWHPAENDLVPVGYDYVNRLERTPLDRMDAGVARLTVSAAVPNKDGTPGSPLGRRELRLDPRQRTIAAVDSQGEPVAAIGVRCDVIAVVAEGDVERLQVVVRVEPGLAEPLEGKCLDRPPDRRDDIRVRRGCLIDQQIDAIPLDKLHDTPGYGLRRGRSSEGPHRRGMRPRHGIHRQDRRRTRPAGPPGL